MAVDWHTIFEQQWNEGQQGYDKQVQEYNNAKAQEQAALDTQLKAGTDSLAKTRDEALRQAYISKRQNEVNLPQMLSANGISGGATETAAASLLRNYQNARNSAGNAYTEGETNLRNTYNTNAATLGSKYATLLAELQQKRRDDAISKAQFAYTAALEKEKMEEEKRRWEEEMAFQKKQYEDQLASSRSSSRYSGGGSGSRSSTGSGNSGQATTVSGGYTPPGMAYVNGRAVGATNTGKYTPQTYTLYGKTYYTDKNGVVHTR